MTADSTGTPSTVAGLIHRAVASVTFPLQLAAVFMFSTEFARQPRWVASRRHSFLVAWLAALALAGLLVSLGVGRWTGVAERLALGTLLVWEVWVSRQLILFDWARARKS